MRNLSLPELVVACLKPPFQVRRTVPAFETEAREEMVKVDASIRRTATVAKDNIYLDCGEDLALSARCLRDVAMAPYFEFDSLLHWPKGSDCNLVRDFIFRSLYLEQVLKESGLYCCRPWHRAYADIANPRSSITTGFFLESSSSS